MQAEDPGVTLDALDDGEVPLLAELMAAAFDADAPDVPGFDRGLLAPHHPPPLLLRPPPGRRAARPPGVRGWGGGLLPPPPRRDFFVRLPPGCCEAERYALHVGGAPGGAAVVWHFAARDAVLGLFFVAPTFQGRGVGRAGWGLLEACYPDVRRWEVAAPGWAPTTVRFYERRCGFCRASAGGGAYVSLVKECAAPGYCRPTRGR